MHKRLFRQYSVPLVPFLGGKLQRGYSVEHVPDVFEYGILRGPVLPRANDQARIWNRNHIIRPDLLG